MACAAAADTAVAVAVRRILKTARLNTIGITAAALLMFRIVNLRMSVFVLVLMLMNKVSV